MLLSCPNQCRACATESCAFSEDKSSHACIDRQHILNALKSSARNVHICLPDCCRGRVLWEQAGYTWQDPARNIFSATELGTIQRLVLRECTEDPLKDADVTQYVEKKSPAGTFAGVSVAKKLPVAKNSQPRVSSRKTVTKKPYDA